MPIWTEFGLRQINMRALFSLEWDERVNTREIGGTQDFHLLSTQCRPLARLQQGNLARAILMQWPRTS